MLGDFTPCSSSKYLALHLRFEEDMVAYSLCHFGGGEYEKKELEAYREVHFPLLIKRIKNSKYGPNSLLPVLCGLMLFSCTYAVDPFSPPLMPVGLFLSRSCGSW
ncbi:hypothetical protein V6N13_023585 [Hibiscus sabdariffa]|uniref:O-fucosyltransferase family protein n=1 Tax=Hibiscus sabdariffa TaxID=183260 RepID=A0ABR2PMA2_9ROSI